MKKIVKYLLSLVFVMSIVFIPAATFALTDILQEGSITSAAPPDTSSPWFVATTFVNTVMICLEIITICVILFACFKLAITDNDEIKFKKAKKFMIKSVISLIIFLIAGSITKYAIDYHLF